jgi:hypothetical protein
MQTNLDNLRAVPPEDVRSADLMRADLDMCASLRRSVTAEDVLNELHDYQDTLNDLLKAEKPDVRLIGGLVLAVFNDYQERLIAQARRAA